MSKPRVSVDGDAKGGWICEVNDGDNAGSYSPEAATREEAEAAALAAFEAEFAETGEQQGSGTLGEDGAAQAAAQQEAAAAESNPTNEAVEPTAAATEAPAAPAA